MTHTLRYSFLLVLAFLLSGCTPGLYVRLFNATGESITVSKTQSKDVTMIASGMAADIQPYHIGERLMVRSSKHLWSYAIRDFYQPHWPYALWEQHMGVMRTYARIDSRGRIHALAPPADGKQPRDTPQPHGFPMSPRNET